MLDRNPFTTADDRPRVLMRPLPKKNKRRLDSNEFWIIYNKAGELGLEFLQIGMGISLLTAMRRGDIVNLRFDQNLIGDHLCKEISKSHEKAERGEGANLRWNLNQNEPLRQLIVRAKELSIRHYNCPYRINRLPEVRIQGVKTHHCQVLPRFFQIHLNKQGMQQTYIPVWTKNRNQHFMKYDHLAATYTERLDTKLNRYKS